MANNNQTTCTVRAWPAPPSSPPPASADPQMRKTFEVNAMTKSGLVLVLLLSDRVFQAMKTICDSGKAIPAGRFFITSVQMGTYVELEISGTLEEITSTLNKHLWTNKQLFRYKILHAMLWRHIAKWMLNEYQETVKRLR